MAEDRGLGFMTGDTEFQLKDPPREDFRYMCMPAPFEQEVFGFVTHVCIRSVFF